MHHRFRLTASHFFCFAKKSNQKKATPTIVLILRCSEKSGTKKTRYAQTVFRSDRFFLPLLGANQRGPIEPIFDRFAMVDYERSGAGVRVTRLRTRHVPKQHRYSLRSISRENVVKLRNKLMIASALALSVSTVYWTFADELVAVTNGVPIRLVSATGSLEPAPGNPFGLQPLTHIHIVPGGALQLVMRTTFHNSSELSRPYLTQDSDGNGVVHIAIRHQPIFGRKCEFVRQFVVEIESEHWRKLKTLSVYNHDVHSPAGVKLAISDAQSLQTMIADSKLKRNLEDTSGAVFGC